MFIDMTENELKEKLVDAIYIIVKRVPDFSPDYNQIAKNGADTIMDIIKEYNNLPNARQVMTQEEKKKLDPLGIYTEEELSVLQYTRDIPNEIKDAMSKLTQGL